MCMRNRRVFGVLIILFEFEIILNVQANQPPCNETSMKLSSVINGTLDRNEIPPDLFILIDKLNSSDKVVNLLNCSKILTLRQYLFNHVIRPAKDDLPRRYYTALYTYAEMKLNMTYIPEGNVDIIILTNSFSSTNLKQSLIRKVQNYFLHYSNWLQVLKHTKFPFDKYRNPRTLLLDMICELVINRQHRAYERDVMFFLILNKHVCRFLSSSESNHNNEWNANANNANLDSNVHKNESSHPLKLPLLNQNMNLNHSDYVRKIYLSGNLTAKFITYTKSINKEIKNETKMFINVSFAREIDADKMFDSDSNSAIIHNLTIFNHSDLTNITSILHNRARIQEIMDSILPIQDKPLVFPEKYNFSFLNVEKMNKNDNKSNFGHMHNFSVWDVVEMDGPCKEGQQHAVKLNIQSLLTVIDKQLSNESLELLKALLLNVKSFPIEDYNARGELLRDLLSAILQNQTNPIIKRTVEEVLDHVMLDRIGALPPKIKLECVNASQGESTDNPRKKRLIISLQYY
ncbi:hypothetical protein ILUMI_19063 [Ignelater luminosus]|uniref:Uncharacterized protein n=1 Tax=Ignelater luminosus TaxID=2038154 RepID=A0A8K0CNU6_IGNLU|nr:hypothetical protein ILUMI_19063 [Ignelater luminosus]